MQASCAVRVMIAQEHPVGINDYTHSPPRLAQPVCQPGTPNNTLLVSQ